MDTLRQLTFTGPGSLAWLDVEQPRLSEDGDALVAPLAVARCDLDFYIAHGLYPLEAPFAIGHEMVGEIVDLGDDAGSFQIGDRVIVPFQISCGSCGRCRRGLTNACERVPPGSAFGLGPHGGLDFGGALSDIVRVPFAVAMLVPLPTGLDPVVAAGIPDNVSDGYRTVAPHLQDTPGAPVLVVGGLAQSVGLYAVQAAIGLGSGRVVYVDDDQERLDLAARLGAATWNRSEIDRDSLGEFPITVDASATPEGLDLAIRSTEPCGVCTAVSSGVGARTELPLRSMYLKGIRFEIGRVHARATTDAVLSHVLAGTLDPAQPITAVVPIDDAAEAMVEPAIKMIFTNAG